jgi:predicted transcriptional regulator
MDTHRRYANEDIGTCLDVWERRKINQEAKDDNDQFALLTCLYGIEQPKFTKEQLEVIESKHPAAVDAIAETIHSLCQFPASMVERELRRLSELPAEPPSDIPT